MPTWALALISSVITLTGGGLLKTQLNIQRELGSIHAMIKSNAQRIDELERREMAHAAEHAADRSTGTEPRYRRAR